MTIVLVWNLPRQVATLTTPSANLIELRLARIIVDANAFTVMHLLTIVYISSYVFSEMHSYTHNIYALFIRDFFTVAMP